MYRKYFLFIVLLLFCVSLNCKSMDDESNQNTVENKVPNKIGGAGMALVFVEELKLMMERHVLGICPQSYKMQLKPKNLTAMTCEIEMDGHEIAGRLASLALRAHSAGRSSDCSRLGSTLANAFSELARTAAQRQINSNSADPGKKRKLSKSQKAKIQAKQRTALAVKKKAAAVAARQVAATVSA